MFALSDIQSLFGQSHQFLWQKSSTNLIGTRLSLKIYLLHSSYVSDTTHKLAKWGLLSSDMTNEEELFKNEVTQLIEKHNFQSQTK
jgi:hypothetical protein